MSTMVKVSVVLLFLVGAFCDAHADDTQELENIYNSFLPNFQKLTPEASALGQYGKYHSSGYSGVPSISVPLFSISSSGFTMPAELCYDASGIKVDQQATYVGLGWNLMIGGSIRQIVCGNNDFYDYSPSPNSELLDSVLPGIGYSPYLCGTFSHLSHFQPWLSLLAHAFLLKETDRNPEFCKTYQEEQEFLTSFRHHSAVTVSHSP